jgi:predicted enzyme related to lactoylglutathione lyase
MRLPAHPVWFWAILVSPVLIWLAVRATVDKLKISLKTWTPWLVGGMILSAIPYFLLEAADGYKVLHLISQAFLYTCWILVTWIQRRYMFETLRRPGAKWYLPWRATQFSIPANTRILVRQIDSVLPWYVAKLGLRKLTFDRGEPGIATLRLKEDGNSVVLTTRGGFQTGKTPILFTKRIDRMRDTMAARGVSVGTIERDQQGIRYFQIRDPEGNEIEIVEDR